MAESFPRLLVAAEFPPNASGGGPAIVRQMLKDWPVERLYWWSCLPEDNQHFGQQVAEHSVARIPRRLYPHRRWCGQKSWLLKNFWTPWATRHFRKTLSRFKPDAVWVIPSGWAIPPLAQVLPSANIGFHVSIHDYADIPGAVAQLGARRSHKLAAMADQLYAAATTRDGICQPMVDDLRARTGCDGNVARAGLEQEDFDFLATPKEAPADRIRIGYAGTVQIEEVFEFFVSALQIIRERLPRPISLEFFGDHSYRTRRWFDPAWMTENGSLPALQLAGELRKCTWGFSPMALTDDDPRYNRFSFPAKFTSYLAAGLPLIVLGHPESSAVKMATAHEVGFCSTTMDLAVLSDRLLKALAEPNPGLKYRAGIRRCATAEFDARRMRAVLYECFQKCASVSRA
jgi:hypothetical protein